MGADSQTSGPSTQMADKVAETGESTLLNWDYAKLKLKALYDAWTTGEEKQTQVRRDLRSVRIDVEDARAKGELDSDETFVPIRIIDSNIVKEAAPFIEYLTQPNRLAIFTSRDGIPDQDLRFRESEFTRVMRYEGWISPFIKVQDGAATHGWDSVEILFDETKPGHVGIEHVRHDELMIPMDTRNLQDCEYVVRKYMVGVYTLRQLIKTAGFLEDRVQKIMDTVKQAQGSTASTALTLYPIYKVMFKVDGYVYVAWWHNEADGWLDGEPRKLFMGRKQGVPAPPEVDALGQMVPSNGTLVYDAPDSMIYETEYPYELLFYRETEMPDIFQHVGRVYLDEPKQEAASSLMTSFVNGTMRASNLVAAPKNNSSGETTLKVLPNVTVQNGAVYNMPLEFTSPPYPDASLLRGIQTIQNLNADESTQVAFAVNNRKDSRKSATEINAAQDQQQTLNGVSLVMQSSFLVRVWSRCEEIVNNRALAGLLEDYCKVDGHVDEQLLRAKIQLRPAGDVDVVERQEKLQVMMQAWPIVQSTPLASVWLQDLIRLALPKDGERYAQLLAQQNTKNAFIQSMVQQVQKLVTDPNTGQLWPILQPAAPMLQQLAQSAQQVIASPV